jgi:hypothetical protein
MKLHPHLNLYNQSDRLTSPSSGQATTYHLPRRPKLPAGHSGAALGVVKSSCYQPTNAESRIQIVDSVSLAYAETNQSCQVFRLIKRDRWSHVAQEARYS